MEKSQKATTTTTKLQTNKKNSTTLPIQQLEIHSSFGEMTMYIFFFWQKLVYIIANHKLSCSFG